VLDEVFELFLSLGANAQQNELEQEGINLLGRLGIGRIDRGTIRLGSQINALKLRRHTRVTKKKAS
jgi:predicted membrane GTPase involved in stress response